MVVCEKYKVIFFHIPKNAGSSVRHILETQFGGEKIQNHIPVMQARAYKSIDNYVNFAVVRNPYSRTVSWYNNLRHVSDTAEHRKAKQIVRPNSFDYFVKKQTEIYKGRETKRFKLWDTQKSFIEDRWGLKVEILRYEILEDDLKNFCYKHFDKKVELPHIKKWGVQNEYAKFYNPELQEIIYNRLKEDFDYFGYSKNIN